MSSGLFASSGVLISEVGVRSALPPRSPGRRSYGAEARKGSGVKHCVSLEPAGEGVNCGAGYSEDMADQGRVEGGPHPGGM